MSAELSTHRMGASGHVWRSSRVGAPVPQPTSAIAGFLPSSATREIRSAAGCSRGSPKARYAAGFHFAAVAKRRALLMVAPSAAEVSLSPPKSVGVCDEITDLAALKRLRVRRVFTL